MLNEDDIKLLLDLVWKQIDANRKLEMSDHSDESNKLFQMKYKLEKMFLSAPVAKPK